jgi:tetratricopeptide (TPR) repeat protein
MSLDDFPTRDDNSELAARAESKFQQSVVDAGHFVLQQRDLHDYGTDFQIEATQAGSMTNCRVHAQLKGTNRTANRDGSISLSVDRTNLNYMLSQTHSIYVCYHAPTEALLVRSAEDVFRDAEHQGEEWRSQETVTIRFRTPFDASFQAMLRARTVAASRAMRDDRLFWMAKPPDEFGEDVQTHVPIIHIPESQSDAIAALRSLYERGANQVISKAFDQFSACIGLRNPWLIYAYLSEINLAMLGKPFSRERVNEAVAFIEAVKARDAPDSLYCRANGHSALGNREEAKRLYQEAIERIGSKNPQLEAQCWKNLGSVIELEGHPEEARVCYEHAIRLSPDLMEAHFALALFHRDHGDLPTALQHFDHVIWSVSEFGSTIAARGHRLEVYFRLALTAKAFDDISVIMPHSKQIPWIGPWCARLVYNYARTNPESVMEAIRFWDALIREEPTNGAAKKERLLCLAYAKMHGQNVGLSFQQYLDQVKDFLAEAPADAALLWDRAGHWAQIHGDWIQAEASYRKSYTLEPDRYGYCLGTALNFLGRYSESLPMLLEQATVHQPDALSWFQVAVAQEGNGDIAGCKTAYLRALDLDPDYDLAMFNLGGVYWNYGPKDEAIRVWKDAVKRFPSHPLAEKLRREFSQLIEE